jgi:hypothetical protein
MPLPSGAQHLAQLLQVRHGVRVRHLLQLIQQRIGDLARPLNVPPVRQPDGGHSLRIRVHHLTFGRTALRAHLAAYRLLAYQLLGLLLDALRQVPAPVVTLRALADRSLADVLLCCDLPKALDARPVVQLDALPLRRLFLFLAHPMKLTGLERGQQDTGNGQLRFTP